MTGIALTPSFAYARLPSGLRLHYAEQGEPGGSPLILLHGYSDSWFTWSRVLPLLSPRCRAYALDLRGHGNSDRPAGSYGMDELASDVVAFMTAQAITGATVVGHSMGSFVAQRVALAAPRRVRRLVLVDSATTPREFEGMLELEEAVNALSDPVSEEFVREFQTSTIHQPVPGEFMKRVVAESRKLPARVWREAMSGMLAANRPEGLKAHGIPTLIAWGERDTFALRKEQDALVALVGGEFRVYGETGHTPHWERPEEFARDLEEFIGRGAV
jgi:pimeloyl-ACP methyl ester carboxylesterase